ncbi:hypothetical protein BC827DRAFT_1270451 [Russula dissimulans]|nr:hypothetical protein BC827DRAFT_1270451 [Russula dissimulans]
MSDKEPAKQWKLADWLSRERSSRSTGLGPLMLLEWRKLRSGVRVASNGRIVDYDESSVRVLAPSHVPPEAIVRLEEGPRGFQESRVLKSPLPERLVLLVKRVAGYPDPGDATGLVHLAPFVS